MQRIDKIISLATVCGFCTVALLFADTANGVTSINKGLEWLKEQQRADGSWGDQNYPAMTALGLWAFSRTNHPDRDKICASAADFIARFKQEDGGIYKPAAGGRGSGGLSTYNTAICMTALNEYDKEKYAAITLNARAFMKGSQIVGDSPDAGGFGYEATVPPLDVIKAAMRKKAAMAGNEPPDDALIARMAKSRRADLSNTGWALMAMRQTQSVEDLRVSTEKVDLNWELALKYVAKLQDNDQKDNDNYGGFGYESTGARGGVTENKSDGKLKLRGFGSMTYAGLESMIYAQVDRSDPRVRSALQWAARHWSVDENPGMGTKGLFYYYNVMGKALSICGVETLSVDAGGKAITWKEEIIGKLASMQKEDGRWVNDDGSFWENDPMLVTAYSVLTLEYALRK